MRLVSCVLAAVALFGLMTGILSFLIGCWLGACLEMLNLRTFASLVASVIAATSAVFARSNPPVVPASKILTKILPNLSVLNC
jgi:uncharacterized membrane protein YiaA